MSDPRLNGAAPAVSLTVDVITSLAGVAALRRDFDELQEATSNALPFALYEWQVAWCKHFLGANPGIVDQPLFHVMRDADRACVAIIPLIQTKRRLGTLQVTSMGLLGADPAITEIRTSLVRPGCEEAVAQALHGRLNGARDWDWIQWLGAGDRFSEAIGRVRSLQWQSVASSYVLDLPDSWEALRARLKRNIRESLRHCYNSMKRDGHHFTVRIASEPESVRTALERLFHLHSLRADMASSVSHPDRFESLALREFVYEVCGALAVRGCVRVFQIESGGGIVASRVGFIVADSLYLYYSGYDPSWGRYSVMTTTVAEAIKYAISQGLKTVNLSPGNDVSKTRWGPREVPHLTAYEHSGRLRSRLVRHAYLKAKSGEGLQGWLLQHLMPGRRMWR